MKNLRLASTFKDVNDRPTERITAFKWFEGLEVYINEDDERCQLKFKEIIQTLEIIFNLEEKLADLEDIIKAKN